MSETEAQTTKKRTKKDDYIVQGSILAAAAVLTKIIGVVYRIPLTNILGDEGNGFYGYAYQVYAIALMISSFSLPTAVSKLVSIRLAKRQRRNAFRVFICSLAFAIGVGLFISLTIFLGAGLISTHLMKSPLSVYALRVLAPGLLIVAVMAVIRGYFQGMGTMLPTAISQIIEQVFNAVISIVGASVLFGIGTKAGEKSGEELLGPAYGAAGSTLGTVVGSLSGLLFLLFVICRLIVVQQYIVGSISNGDRGFQLMCHIVGEIRFKFLYRFLPQDRIKQIDESNQDNHKKQER